MLLGTTFTSRIRTDYAVAATMRQVDWYARFQQRGKVKPGGGSTDPRCYHLAPGTYLGAVPLLLPFSSTAPITPEQPQIHPSF